MSFNDIPPEILARALRHVHPGQLAAFRSVCRIWRNTIDGDPVLQYMLELWEDGLLEGNPQGLLPHERIARAHLLSTERPYESRASEMAQGVFALQESEAMGGRMLVVALAGLKHVPYVYADDSTAVWTGSVHLPGKDIRHFTMDAGSDLLAVLHSDADFQKGTLAVRSLAQPTLVHPEAVAAEIEFACTRDEMDQLGLTTVDDVVALSTGARLLLFDWRGGNCVLDWDFAPMEVLDCYMLAPRLVLLVHGPASGAVKVYMLPDVLEPGVSAPACVATLHLPPLSTDHIHIAEGTILAGPYTARPPADAPFFQANDRRVVSLGVQYVPGGWVWLVFHIRTVSRLVTAWRADPGRREQELQWADWGPAETRVSQENALFWWRHVHGERILACSTTDRLVRMLDFNVPRSTDHGGAPEIDPAAPLAALGEIVAVAEPDSVLERECDVLHTDGTWCQPPIIATVRAAGRREERTVAAGVFARALHTALPVREVRRPLRPRRSPLPDEARVLAEGEEADTDGVFFWVNNDNGATYDTVVMDERWIVVADSEEQEVAFLRIAD
ncbi:F-box domain-containing protein [Mycena indigotica]|uniref:F-box domain-containing protein n=1 Tax=Mycena indigotica TaxID=2126181 RepID=A0A8H6T2M0_9AGAR|nr:F-box domain-containing protein [Mycena indigotica]KAF7309232.1 F-box domain-containing protein [Mycena indigotica]